jgi:DNA-binding XRE family transcriptional regulator
MKAQRQEDELTQEHVAHEADLTLRHYQHIEAGRMNATIRTLFDEATALGPEVRALMDGAYGRKQTRRPPGGKKR